MSALKLLAYINTVIAVLMTAAYFYQFVYTGVGLIFRKAKPEPEAKTLHRFAALICARNEAGVIGELVESLKKQNYPADLLDIYVLADNCTDYTAHAAAQAGATVFVRRDEAHVGKGYALDYLLARVRADATRPYDAYFIFDADNLVDPDFVAEMNKTFDRGDYDAVTSYRNSKNFGANWISAGYSIWFLREARFLNYPRMLLGNGCAVSGTGFLVSERLVAENGGWPFHLLTEDIQFSVTCALKGRKIGYCDRAVVYDEQPTSFAQSWTQRLRWSKGFYQVDARYLFPLAGGIFKKRGARMTCYDMLMTVAPIIFLTVATVFLNVFILFVALSRPRFVTFLVVRELARILGFTLISSYFGMLGYGLLTVLSEWKRIKAPAFKKIIYLWVFPIFLATYIPISLAALGQKVEWTQIRHYSTRELAVPGSEPRR